MAGGQLFGRYLERDLGATLSALSGYRPFPTADDREEWSVLPAHVRRAGIQRGEDLSGSVWPALPAALYMDFARTGNRSRYERPYFRRRDALKSLVLAECMEGEGRFLDDIINGIWAICEESSWVIPAHNRADAHLDDVTTTWIDLFAGETGSLLAWTHYLLQSRLDAVDPLIAGRMRREVALRVLGPFLTHDDYWWMGVEGSRRPNNWSPWCSSSVLGGFLLLEPDAERRTQAVRKVMEIIDRWVAVYHPDGGCEEGPRYWMVAAASLLDCLELLRTASGDEICLYDEPLVREMGRYIYRAHISGDYYVNFADAPATINIPAGLVYSYGQLIDDPRMVAFGSWACGRRADQAPVEQSLLRTLRDLFAVRQIETSGKPPYVRDVWLGGTQSMAAREADGSDRGLYLAAKGGHNNESGHNHNDVGEFIVYVDGEPVLVDVGVGTYTAQTFSRHRYEIWTMQSAYHNLPTVNGIQQQAGEEFRATDVTYHADDVAARFSLDIAGAYPKSSGVTSWRRTCCLHRDNPRVEVAEEFELARPSAEIMLSLMTPIPPVVNHAGAVTLGPVDVTFDGTALTASTEEIQLDDEGLRSSWGERLFRLVLRPRAATRRATWMTRIARKAPS
jgi:hypothetical protein